MLTKCRACKKEVDHDAKTCPHCGAPKPGQPPVIVSVIGGVIVLAALFLFFGPDKKTDTPSNIDEPAAQTATESPSEKVDVRSLAQKSFDFVNEEKKTLDLMVKNGGFTIQQYRSSIEKPAFALLNEWPGLNRYQNQEHFQCFLYLDTFRLWSEHYFNAKGKKPMKNEPVYIDLDEQIREQSKTCQQVLKP